jgi:hypothetical protein
MSKTATAEDYIALTFEGVPDAEAPSRDDWMRRTKDDHRTLTKAMSTLRYSSAELAEIIRKEGQFEVFGALMDSLIEMNESHSALIGRLDSKGHGAATVNPDR